MSDEPLQVKVKRVGSVEVPLPSYQSSGASGLDLHAALPGRVILEPGARELVPTGLALEIPPGHEGQIRPRSGLALHHGVTVLNTPGTVDCDFRGEVGIVLVNLGSEDFVVEPGMRVAQLVFCPVVRCALDVVVDLQPTSRADGGYGSTGA